MRTLAWLGLSISFSGCATLNESMSLGAVMGSIAGGSAMAIAQASQGGNRSFAPIALSSGLGASLGIITSYFTHKEVIERRQACETDAIDMRFGDLPPSPFIVPKKINSTRKP